MTTSIMLFWRLIATIAGAESNPKLVVTGSELGLVTIDSENRLDETNGVVSQKFSRRLGWRAEVATATF